VPLNENVVLRGFVARIIGWAPERAEAVEQALCSIELAAARRSPLVLLGETDLVPIAQALHRRTLGADRPFVLADPRRGNTPAMARAPTNYRSGVAAFEAATDGTLCVRSRRPPRDFARVMNEARDAMSRDSVTSTVRVFMAPVDEFNGEPTTAPVLDHSAAPARRRAWRRRKG
jgi:hypothetical protein